MNRFIHVFGSFILILAACQSKMKIPEGDFSIHAHVEGVDTVIFEKIEANNLLLLDTLFAVDGEFVIANSLEGSAFFLLRTPEGEGINLLIEKGEKLEIKGKRLKWNENYRVKGSKGSTKIQELNSKLNTFEKNMDFIYEEAKNAKQEDYISIQNRFNNILSQHTDYLKHFIDSNLTSKSSILALFQSVKGENILDPKEDINYYIKVSQSFQKNWPNASHTKLLNEVIKTAYAQDFSMENINGERVTFNDIKGKLTLIDVWASWCKPCRAANPGMVKLYNKFKDQGLEMIGISLDGISQQKNPKEDWIKAVSNDQLTWSQLSDLKGWDSEIRNVYTINSIPHTLLIDDSGLIIGENLSETALNEKITEILTP